MGSTPVGFAGWNERARNATAERPVRYSAMSSIAAELADADDIDAEWDAYTVEQNAT